MLRCERHSSFRSPVLGYCGDVAKLSWLANGLAGYTGGYIWGTLVGPYGVTLGRRNTGRYTRKSTGIHQGVLQIGQREVRWVVQWNVFYEVRQVGHCELFFMLTREVHHEAHQDIHWGPGTRDVHLAVHWGIFFSATPTERGGMDPLESKPRRTSTPHMGLWSTVSRSTQRI